MNCQSLFSVKKKKKKKKKKNNNNKNKKHISKCRLLYCRFFPRKYDLALIQQTTNLRQFSFFPENKLRYTVQIVSTYVETICTEYRSLFSGKKKENCRKFVVC